MSISINYISAFFKMNKAIFFSCLLLIIASSGAWGQKKLTEGTLSYDIVINTGSDKPQNADFFDGATNVVYIKGNKTRTDMVSSLGTQSTIIDGKNAITILKEYGEQKYLVKLTQDDWKDANKKNENVVFSFDGTETRTIAGYLCKKAVGKLSDGTSFIAWYTTDLVTENKDFQYATRNLPGLAMEYETTLGNVKVTYTVSKINFAAVAASKFDLPKSGFRVLTYQESKG